MPPVRSLRLDADALHLDDGVQGVRVFPWSNLPANPRTVEGVESAITAWLRQSADGSYQVAVHVHEVDPLRVSVLTANLGESISGVWWED